ncbi:hypothetical protein HN51_054101 [Arachis hypogaea]
MNGDRGASEFSLTSQSDDLIQIVEDVRVYSLGSCWAFSSTGAIEGINAIEENKVVSIDGYNDVAKSDSALLCAIVKQPISAGHL